MKLWIARDKDNTLTVFQGKPQLSEYDPIWQELYNEDYMTIDPFLFPEVTFGNSPQRVEIKLINNE